jgi:glycerophosphoryl diester phosphodiesterase
MPGTVTSPIEVVQLTPHGVWIAYHDDEFFLDHDLFPWFTNATAKEVFNVQELSTGHFYWPDIDIDLDLERIQHPERFPLVAKNRE